jgi:hypothetical protein
MMMMITARTRVRSGESTVITSSKSSNKGSTATDTNSARRVLVVVKNKNISNNLIMTYCSNRTDEQKKKKNMVRTMTTTTTTTTTRSLMNRETRGVNRHRVRATKEDKQAEIEEITKKWGLEAGLWNIFKSTPETKKKNTDMMNGEEQEQEGTSTGEKLTGSRMDMAKQLLKTYGSAYLITSISLSLVSFGVFYVLVSSGVDVAALLSVIGITATQNSEKVGTVAIAYAAHKAASPIRFPPTVALTPIVAKWMGKIPSGDEKKD